MRDAGKAIATIGIWAAVSATAFSSFPPLAFFLGVFAAVSTAFIWGKS